jgi:nicotinate-nucleotide adenylyltransferase
LLLMALRVLYGGTFDPVHDGHIAVALAAARALGTDIAMLPSADPPHRAPPGASAEQRAAMLDLAVAPYPQLGVDRRELRRKGPSYTVDTLHDVRAEVGPNAPLVWLLGADAFRELQTWREWRQLFALAHLVVAVRPGHALDHLDAGLVEATSSRWIADAEALRSTPAGLLWRLDMPPQHEAASSVRERIAAGEEWEDDVPPAVAQYIQAHRLYTAS